jgi:hypothetical protein
MGQAGHKACRPQSRQFTRQEGQKEDRPQERDRKAVGSQGRSQDKTITIQYSPAVSGDMILGHRGLDDCDMVRTGGHQLQPLFGTVHVAKETNSSLPVV